MIFVYDGKIMITGEVEADSLEDAKKKVVEEIANYFIETEMVEMIGVELSYVDEKDKND